MARRTAKVGDVVMLLEPKKVGPASYRLALVSAVHPDAEGHVRTVTLSLPNRRRRGQQGAKVEVKMAVQRLAMLLPVEEQGGPESGPQ